MERWGTVLTQMMIYIFAEETLSALLELNKVVIFNEILLLFLPDQLSVLHEHENEATSALRASYKRNNNKQSMVEQKYEDVNRIVDSVLEILTQQLQDNEKLKDVFDMFLGEVLMIVPNIRLVYAYRGIINMLKNPYDGIYRLALQKSYQFIN